MPKKKISTSVNILEKVSPVFNKQGFVGTSLTDISEATELTKGAVYGNFENKEDLALKAFRLNMNRIIKPVKMVMSAEKKSYRKLLAMTEWYRENYDVLMSYGGCPLLNAGVDSKYINPEIFSAAREASTELSGRMSSAIKKGIRKKEINKNVKPGKFSKRLLSMIEGGLFLSFLHEDKKYLDDILDHIDEIISKDLRIKKNKS